MEYKVGSLYAGIGGICKGFQLAASKDTKVKIVWANEWDEAACGTYGNNFKHKLYAYGIKKFIKNDLKKAEDINILTSGFPCQAFSIAGYRKGFEDARGNHFFETMKVLEEKQPRAFLFENVKSFMTHAKGNTYKVVEEFVANAGYSLIPMVFNTMEYSNLPQNRERIYMVGFRGEKAWIKARKKTCSQAFKEPNKSNKLKKIEELLSKKQVDEKYYYDRFSINRQLLKEMKQTDTIYQWRRVYVRENKNKVCPTLTANMGTGGHNVPLILENRGNKKRVRKLTPEECAAFQGLGFIRFPEKMPDASKYKQIGNSVSVPVIKKIAMSIINALDEVKN